MRRLLVPFFAAVSATAQAATFEIAATTVGQGYELGAADGSVVARRRLSQLVRVGGYDLLDQNRLYFISGFRFDSDFGLTDADLAIPGPRHLRQGIRELQTTVFTLLYGYLAGRDLYGLFDFDAGRQFVVDLVDYYHFDGIRVGANTPWRFGVEAYAGWEVRAGASLGASAFDLPGVSEVSDRAPTWGVGLYLRDTHWGPWSLSGKVTYRKTQATRSLAVCSVDPSALADCDRLTFAAGDADRRAVEEAFGRDLVLEERISANLQVRMRDARVWGGFSYNLVNGWFDDLLAGYQHRLLGERLALEIEYLRTRPRFDADSIFNLFATNALDDLRVKASWGFGGGWEAYARGFVRFFHAQSAAFFGTRPTDDLVTARGAVVGARIPHGTWSHTTVDVIAQAGYGGYLFGGDAWTRWSILERKLDLDARLLVLRFDDDRRENLHGINVTLQGGARWQLHQYLALHVILEESFNRLYTSVFRLYGMLDVAVWL